MDSDNPLVPIGSSIPSGSLEILEVDCIWMLNLKLFAPFNNIHTLVISARLLLKRRWDSGLQFRRIFAELKARMSISEPVLPNLRTLGLCFEYSQTSSPESMALLNDHYKAGLCMAEVFIRRRLDEENPIQTFRVIGFLPKALESGPEFTWIRDASGAKIELTRRKDDFALRLMYPY